MKRKCGILLAVSSLPGAFGIGTMGEEAYGFIDLLAEAGQSLWQVLPLSPPGAGNSPYQSVSVYAGNPDLIDFALLYKDSLLSKNELEQCCRVFENSSRERTDYKKQKEHKKHLLEYAYRRAKPRFSKELCDFAYENAHWIYDYAFFMAISQCPETASPKCWPCDLHRRDPDALMRYAVRERDKIGYYIFEQFIFFRQWSIL